MAKKLTPWFDGRRVSPVRKGEYEVHRELVSFGYPKRTRLLWNGYEWRHTEHSSCGRFVGGYAWMKDNGDKWRGLAQDPNAKQKKGKKA